MGEDGTAGLLLGCVIAVALMLALPCSSPGAMHEQGQRKGQCQAQCHPEKLIEVVNDGRECLCTKKRVKRMGAQP